jgi:hypothetical protein
VLVINAPASLNAICVQAKVESAHIYAYDQSQRGALLIVSNEAHACIALKPGEEPHHVAVPALENELGPLPSDIGIVYEKEIPGPPRERVRTKTRDQMNAVNRYVEEYITRGMLDSVLSSRRYRATDFLRAHPRRA